MAGLLISNKTDLLRIFEDFKQVNINCFTKKIVDLALLKM